jgi:hypothetical protein
MRVLAGFFGCKEPPGSIKSREFVSSKPIYSWPSKSEKLLKPLVSPPGFIKGREFVSSKPTHSWPSKSEKLLKPLVSRNDDKAAEMLSTQKDNVTLVWPVDARFGIKSTPRPYFSYSILFQLPYGTSFQVTWEDLSYSEHDKAWRLQHGQSFNLFP